MEAKKLSLLVILVLVIATLPSYGATANQSTPLGWEQPSPFTDLLTAYTAHVYPGDELVIHLRTHLNINSLYIYAILAEGYQLNIINETLEFDQENLTVHVYIPENTPTGVYDLFVVAEEGTYRVPQSVWVSTDCPTPLRIAHLTDQHFDLHPDYYVSAVILAKLLGAKIYVGTGDSTDTASELQAKHYVMHRSSFLYGVPALENPGNHDHESDTTGTPYFKKYIAPEYWYRNYCNKILIIGLNTGKDANVITQEELDFAENILKEYNDTPIKIVGYHHPFFYHHGNLTSTYDDPGLPPYLSTSFWYGKNPSISLEFLRIIEEYRVLATLQGHVHSDSMVNFTSERTGYKTWFITTTTTGGPHAEEIYNGFQIIDVYPNDTVKFPFAPPTFKVPTTYSVHRTGGGYYPKQSIPVQLDWPQHFYAKYYEPTVSQTFAIEFENTLGYLNVSNTTIIRIPWELNSVPNFYLVDYNGVGEIKLLDTLVPGDGYLYMLLDVNMPNGTHLMLVGTTVEDDKAPTASLKMVMPPNPTVGFNAAIYLEVGDQGWGIKSIEAYNAVTGETYDIGQSGNYYLLNLKITDNNMTVLIKLTDLAGHKSYYSLQIINGKTEFKPTQPPEHENVTSAIYQIPASTTSQTTETTSTTTTTTSTTTTTTTQITIITTSEEKTTTTSTTQTTTTTTSETTHIESSTTTEEGGAEGSEYYIIGFAIIIAIVIMGIALFMKR